MKTRNYQLTEEESKDHFFKLPSDRDLLVEDKDIECESSETAFTLIYGQTPHYLPIDPYAAFRTRLIVYANAALYAVENDDRRPGVVSRIRASIKTLLQQKLAELDAYAKLNLEQPVFDTELYDFLHIALPAATKLTADQLIRAENWYIWQHVPQPVRITLYPMPSLKAAGEKKPNVITQIEKPRAVALTYPQKYNLCSIHNPHEGVRPQWFRDLYAWEQKILRNIIPKEPDGDWDNYQKFRPTNLRFIPGEAISAQHEIFVHKRTDKKEREEIAHVVSLRQGAPTSFYMKKEEERQASARQNLAQMLDQQILPPSAEVKEPDEKAECHAVARFRETWGFIPEEELQLPILVTDLVTPSEKAKFLSKFFDVTGLSGSENNTKLAREKAEAIAYYKSEHRKIIKSLHLRIFNLNIPTNGQRSAEFVADVEFGEFIRFAAKFHERISKRTSQLSQKAQKKLDALGACVKILNEHTNIAVTQGYNKHLFLAALCEVTTQLMGGTTAGNCKSSKDRKTIEMIMADALILLIAEQIANNEQIHIPSPGEKSPARERLVEFFCVHYVSAHQSLFSHTSSPGSVGIKNEKVLDLDIIEKLQTMSPQKKQPSSQPSLAIESKQADNPTPLSKHDQRGAYGLSTMLAEWNKPGTFFQKHAGKIKRWGSVAVGILVGIITLACLASGVGSPLALIGIPASMALTYGGVTSGELYRLRVIHKFNSFAAQIRRVNPNYIPAKLSDSVTIESSEEPKPNSGLTYRKRSSRGRAPSIDLPPPPPETQPLLSTPETQIHSGQPLMSDPVRTESTAKPSDSASTHRISISLGIKPSTDHQASPKEPDATGVKTNSEVADKLDAAQSDKFVNGMYHSPMSLS